MVSQHLSWHFTISRWHWWLTMVMLSLRMYANGVIFLPFLHSSLMFSSIDHQDTAHWMSFGPVKDLMTSLFTTENFRNKEPAIILPALLQYVTVGVYRIFGMGWRFQMDYLFFFFHPSAASWIFVFLLVTTAKFYVLSITLTMNMKHYFQSNWRWSQKF